MAQPPAEIVRHVAVEIELARLDQPQHAERDDQLGDRSDAHRIVGRDRPAARPIGLSLGDARLDLSVAVEMHRDCGGSG